MDDRLVILMNSDVKMSRGKYAAQAVHAALLAFGAHPGVPVIVLGAHHRELETLRTQVHDAGRTEVEPGTLTAGTDWAATPRVIDSVHDLPWFESVLAQSRGVLAATTEDSWPSWYKEYRSGHTL